MSELIPEGIRYSSEHDNFYDANGNGMGNGFWGNWYQRRKEFPQCDKKISVPDLLTDMANTYRERNAVYGDNWRTVGTVMAALYPKGVVLHSADEFNKWHLFELIIVKLTRFVNSQLNHADSIHDIAVYAAMIEAILQENQK